MTRIKFTVPDGKALKTWNGFYDLSSENDRTFLSVFGLDDFDVMRVGDRIIIECIEDRGEEE